MKYTLPSNNIACLKSLIGQKIIEVNRRVFKSDLSLKNYEQMADGLTKLVFSNNTIISFFPWTEINSVGVAKVETDRCDGEDSILKNTTNNSFWQKRVNQTITKITIIQSVYASAENPSEFAVEFEFANDKKICIEYINEEKFAGIIVFDSLIIIKQNKEIKFVKTEIV